MNVQQEMSLKGGKGRRQSGVAKLTKAKKKWVDLTDLVSPEKVIINENTKRKTRGSGRRYGKSGSGQGPEPPVKKIRQQRTNVTDKESNSDAPDSVAARVQRKKEQSMVPRRAQTAPFFPRHHQSPTPGISFTNSGPGTENARNTCSSTLSIVGNDHSENHHYDSTRQCSEAYTFGVRANPESRT